MNMEATCSSENRFNFQLRTIRGDRSLQYRQSTHRAPPRVHVSQAETPVVYYSPWQQKQLPHKQTNKQQNSDHAGEKAGTVLNEPCLTGKIQLRRRFSLLHGVSHEF